jgi:alginate O-acetyltransferase complex protein AlgI
MVFSSIVFVFFFLPVVLIAHTLLPARARNLFLLAVSVVFYAWGEVRFLWVMFTSSLLDYLAGLVIGREQERIEAAGGDRRRKTALQKTALAASLTGNLGLLCFFKYAGFFVENVAALAQSAGLGELLPASTLNIALPLGISFYTFQSLSYTIDVYRGSIRYTRSVVDFLCFVTLFPQLVAGPIVRYRDLAAELVRRSVALGPFAEGARRFAIGLGKKKLIANTVAVAADRIFAIPGDRLPAGVAWLGTFSFTFQLYYDFAGYSDMAIGLGLMLGFNFPQNFNYPYISRTMAEFWQRWHITLSTWLRDYLFTPLGGYRRGRTRGYLNVLITFILCGFWHGAAWTFIAFGAICGGCIVFERVIQANRRPFFRSYTGCIFYLMPVVLFTMVVFRSESMHACLLHWKAMLGLNGDLGDLYSVRLFTDGELGFVMLAAAAGSVPLAPRLARWLGGFPRLQRIGALLWSVAILALCSLKLAAGTYNPFIYFRF